MGAKTLNRRWKAIARWIGHLREVLFGRSVSKTENALVGEWGEDVAVRQLRAEGYDILARRVRPDQDRDEIDIIAQRDGTLVFVEVKARRNEDFGRPAMAVDRRKRIALRRGADAYLRRARNPPVRCRFDIIEVIGLRESERPPVVRHIEGAFPFRRS